MNASLYLSFLAVSAVVLVLPGPSLAYAVAVGMQATPGRIVLNALGMALGGLLITLAVAWGVANLVASSALAFDLLKFAGCLYLVTLGLLNWRGTASRLDETAQAHEPPRAGVHALLQGLLVETANPKAILFYVSLLPQFIDPAVGPVRPQLVLLGASFALMQVAWDTALMLVVRRLKLRLQATASPLWRRLSGGLFVVLGLALLFQERPVPAAR